MWRSTWGHPHGGRSGCPTGLRGWALAKPLPPPLLPYYVQLLHCILLLSSLNPLVMR